MTISDNQNNNIKKRFDNHVGKCNNMKRVIHKISFSTVLHIYAGVIKSFIFLFLLCTLYNSSIYSQSAPSLPKIIPPSPNAAALQKYGDIPVSPYTGIPNISIPMYTVQYKDITLPVSISYHASGIKVAEDASQVGLGWALNAGGVISRNIIGGDDFLGDSYFNSTFNSLPDFSDGQGPLNPVQRSCILRMFNRTNPNQYTIYDDTLTSAIMSQPAYEYQPDQYFFNFAGHSGKFIIKRNKQVVLESQEKLDITVTTTSSVTGNSFQVKTNDGFIYDFNDYETYLDVGQFGGPHNTAWYLTKITSPLGNTVTLNYTHNGGQVTTIGAYSELIDATELVTSSQINGSNRVSQHFGPQRGISPDKIYSHTALSSIDFTNGVVKFEYSGSRSDLPGDQRLDAVSVYSKNSSGIISTSPIKTFNFSYSYFSAVSGDIDNDYAQSSQGQDVNYKRLKLTQLSETGYYNNSTITQPPYTFTYFEGGGVNDLPSKASFARDHWGYSNGHFNNSSLIPTIIPVNSPDYITSIIGIEGPERDVDPTYMQAYTLSSIKYPAGGSTNFEYETNDFDEQKSLINDHSFFSNQREVVAKLVQVNFDNHTHIFNNNTVDMSDEYTNLDPNSPGSLLTHLDIGFRFDPNSNTCNIGATLLTFDIYNEAGAQILEKDYHLLNTCGSTTNDCLICGNGLVSSYNTDLYLPPGKYTVSVNSDNSLTYIEDIHFNFTYYTSVLVSQNNIYGGASNYNYGGGLRIKRITDHDGINTANDKIKKYVYHYFEDRDNDGTREEYSYGRRMCRPQYSAFEWSNESYVETEPDYQYFQYTAAHFMRNSDSNIPLNGSAGGAVVGYDKVTVLNGENGEYGETQYEYYNQPDQVDSYIEDGGLPCRSPYSSTLPYLLNGSLLQEIDYKKVNGNFIPVKSVDNTYSLESYINTNNENRVYGMEIRTPTLFNYGNGHIFNSAEATPICNSYFMFYITLQSEWPHLDVTDEKVYDANDVAKYLETITNYTYNSTNYLPYKTVTSNSKKQLVTSTTIFPFDYTTVTGSDAFSLGIKNLQNSHVYTAPVEKYTSISNQDGTNLKVTGAVLNSFHPSKPVPSVISAAMLLAPSTTFNPASTSATSSSKDPSYQPVIDLDSYDASGNIVQDHKDNDVKHSYIWDYNSSMPIAEVINAQISDVAYTSFEANGTGNWTLNNGAVNTSAGITGTNSYTLGGSNSVSAANLTSGNYTVSYWLKAGSGSVSINGSSATLITTKNGWSLYTLSLTNITSVSVSGNAIIDELRLYPSGAQMTTSTYDPLIGITTQCDVNNRITSYSYDGLGRLKEIRDLDNNVIKRYDYQYQQPQ